MQPGQTVPNAAPNPGTFPAPISPADAAAYCNAADVSSIPGFTQSVYDNEIEAINEGQILFNPPDLQCQGVAPAGANLQLVSTATGLSLTTADTLAATVGAGTAAGSVVPVIGTIVGSIIGLFVAIFQHHALVTKAEQNAECALIPAANNYLQIIQNAVATGQATPAQGAQALDSLFADFGKQAFVNPSYKESGTKECSALCVYAKQLCGIVNYLKAQYQHMTPVAGAVSAGAGGVTVGGTTLGLPALALAALAAWVLFT